MKHARRAIAVPRQQYEDADKSETLSDPHVGALLERTAVDHEVLVDDTPTPMQGIYIGVVVGAMIWSLIAVGVFFIFF